MSKRTAFSQKSEQRHWRLRHDQEEAKRQMKRAQKLERKTGSSRYPDTHAAQDTTSDQNTSGSELDPRRDH